MPNSSSAHDDAPIVATIIVKRVTPAGVHAVVNDQPHRFKDLRTLFKVALHLLDTKGTTP